MFLVWPSTSGFQRLFTSNAILSICRIILEILSLFFGCVWCILYVECVIWWGEAFLCSELCYYVSWPIFAIIRSVRTHNNPETTEKQCRIHSTKKTEKKFTKPARGNVLRMRGYWSSCLRMSEFIWDAYFMLCQAVYGCLWFTFSSISVFISLSHSLKSHEISLILI